MAVNHDKHDTNYPSPDDALEASRTDDTWYRYQVNRQVPPDDYYDEDWYWGADSPDFHGTPDDGPSRFSQNETEELV